ncbi:agglutinin cell wall attachment protein [Leucobacter denitrificans]|uniref:Agglutinin cell wall attachment protein n=1 Tax=Leucobacter denitrificans TaxID=683042 RepID=A0A7G9S7C4_9MICO|nr:agglutinin cell wall attachment protein [Leucobacter denitrificans]QNN63749.1 agglutinin cell wall attachment protein [Leucobacter denitrificans]
MSVESEFPVPPMIRQGELIEQITALVPQEVKGDWSRLDSAHRLLSMYGQSRIDVAFSDGTSGYALEPREASKLVRELREVMYRPGTGTWFSALWTLTKDASGVVSADVSFNYDEEPDWSRPIDPGLYGIDLEDFPRDEDHIPVWLREMLAEAEKNASETE